MNYIETLKKQKQAFDFLDTKDLSSLLIRRRSIYDIAYDIERLYDNEYSKQEGLFDYIDNSELMDYLQKRYDITFYESIDFLVGICN